MRKIEPLTVAVFAALLWLGFYGGQIKGCPVIPPVDPVTVKATAATYVYTRGTPIPNPVLAALDKLNQKNIRATTFPHLATDGDNQIPDQYKVPLAAAKEVGLPAVVATAGEKVLKVKKDPQTEEDVLEIAL